jgi:hypothetical protein
MMNHEGTKTTKVRELDWGNPFRTKPERRQVLPGVNQIGLRVLRAFVVPPASGRA